MTTIIILVVIILFALYNSEIIKWGSIQYNTETRKEHSVNWHFMGGLIRFVIIVIIVSYNFTEFTDKTMYKAAGMVMLNWVVYDLFLNIFRGLPVFYKGSEESGSTSFIDKVFRNEWIYKILKLLALFAAVLLITSCRTKKDIPQEPVVLNNGDSTSILVKYIVNPADSFLMLALLECDSDKQVVIKKLNNSTSAGLQSNINFNNGVLSAKVIKPSDSVRHETIVRVISRSYPVYVPKPYYVEKEFTKWQSFKIVLGEIFMIIIGLALLFGGFKLYKKFA